MNRTKSQSSQRNSSFRLERIALAVLAFVAPLTGIFAQAGAEANGFRIGERLNYNVSIGRFANAAYGELYCVSRGRLGDKDAIEVRAKFKTLDLASAAFYLIDESRTTFISPSTGLPLYTSVNQNAFGLPKETVQNFLSTPTPHADLLTMIYRLRQSGGTGSLTMQDGDKVYSVTFQSGAAEKQRTDAGEFETTIVSVQSEYFIEHGMTDVRVNVSNDDVRLPVVIRFHTSKGDVRAGLASVQTIEPETVSDATPEPVRPPLPERTPRPIVTPTPYIDNQPLTADLAFELGERLEYEIVSGGRQVAMMRLAAKERKQFDGVDGLLLEATFSDMRPGSPFAVGDVMRAYVNPDTLAPRELEMKFSGSLRAFSSVVRFEEKGSSITIGGNRIDAPVGTHSILSLLFAARSFNLKPSSDLNNPINDTRVAVLWESQPHVFTLRPSPADVIMLDGKPVGAQLVTVSTKNSILDQLNIQVWLGNDHSRIPLRFIIGTFQANLVAASKVIPN
ncbi:MAG: DUF3108 domain-containing protein [Acidobacteriota bacterium]